MIGLILGNWKLAVGVGAAVALVGVIGWARWDAVRDDRARQAAEAAKVRIEAINDAREIENETRTDTDDAIFDCLRGVAC